MLSKPWPLCVHDDEEQRLTDEIDRHEAILERYLTERFKVEVFGPRDARKNLVLGFMPALDAYMRTHTGCDCEVHQIHERDGAVTIVLRPRRALIRDFWKHVFFAFVRNKSWARAWNCDIHVIAQQSERDLYGLTLNLGVTVLYADERQTPRYGRRWVVGVLGREIPEGPDVYELVPARRACSAHCAYLEDERCGFPCIQL